MSNSVVFNGCEIRFLDLRRDEGGVFSRIHIAFSPSEPVMQALGWLLLLLFGSIAVLALSRLLAGGGVTLSPAAVVVRSTFGRAELPWHVIEDLQLLDVSGTPTMVLCISEGRVGDLDDQDQIPGIATVYASTCTECSAACGLHVRTREGRADSRYSEPIHLDLGRRYIENTPLERVSEQVRRVNPALDPDQIARFEASRHLGRCSIDICGKIKDARAHPGIRYGKHRMR